MNKKQKKPKRRLKTKSLILRLVSLLLLIASGFLVYGIIEEVRDTVAFSQELDEARANLALIQQENRYLTEQREKLENPDFIRSYVRGEFFYTREGEQVFRLPQRNEEE